MGLTTLLGRARLDVQDALRRRLEERRAPNFIVVSLRRDAVRSEFGSIDDNVRTRFRREISSEVRRMLEAYGWITGGCGALSINILFRSIDTDCDVRARFVTSFARLRIHDDDGIRIVQLVGPSGRIGRDHRPLPPGFIPLYDSLRLISREHFELAYQDLELRGKLLGRNPTTRNGVSLETGQWFVMATGDVLRCGACELWIEHIEAL